MHRSCIFGLLAGIIGLIGVAQAAGQQICRPALAITGSAIFRDAATDDGAEMDRGRFGRRVTLRQGSAGYFEIGFSRLKENALDIEFSKEFVWLPPSVKVSVDFWVDEAVERHWINKVSACPCAR